MVGDRAWVREGYECWIKFGFEWWIWVFAMVGLALASNGRHGELQGLGRI